ncbi:hypothetical protein B0T13DRAFT_457046 [Neurospora crassa]|nr:hypothetical protein B0T13DRAFT_457046 [Neurospora crassa]
MLLPFFIRVFAFAVFLLSFWNCSPLLIVLPTARESCQCRFYALPLVKTGELSARKHNTCRGASLRYCTLKKRLCKSRLTCSRLEESRMPAMTLATGTRS